MTPEQHNKFLAWSHLGYGLLFFLFMAVFMIFFGVVFLSAMSTGPTPPPAFLFVFVWLFIAAMYAAMTVPSIVAGYGLLKKKKWARTWSIISAVIAAMNFPFGTAVCVYTFWFLFGDQGKIFFDQNNNNYALPPGAQAWANDSWNYDANRQREAQHQPPPTPPDWR